MSREMGARGDRARERTGTSRLRLDGQGGVAALKVLDLSLQNLQLLVDLSELEADREICEVFGGQHKQKGEHER